LLHHGRGSAFGFKPSPSIKLAPTTTLYVRQTEDMDINCGDILDGVTIEAKGREILDKVIAVASGESRSRRSSATATTSSCPGRSAP